MKSMKRFALHFAFSRLKTCKKLGGKKTAKILKNTRRCPSCGVATERSTGCPMMTCPCKTVWCYRCGRLIGFKLLFFQVQFALETLKPLTDVPNVEHRDGDIWTKSPLGRLLAALWCVAPCGFLAGSAGAHAAFPVLFVMDVEIQVKYLLHNTNL